MEGGIERLTVNEADGVPVNEADGVPENEGDWVKEGVGVADRVKDLDTLEEVVKEPVFVEDEL